ncbi:MAG: ATP-binding protein [Lachnospiraceae bacterium]|nr:ATP-binding protein [Lachnospiraceae bacterium]
MLRGFLERRPDCTVIGPEEEAVFAKLCIQRVESDDGKNVGRVIYPDLKLDDVKVKPAIRAVLDDVVDSIRNSPVVLDSWGLRKNYPYGRSVSLLLSGPPGTGKTMTANAIAGELSLPLYQVNLSNIVDKYIGETEKNLEKAFLFAEKTDAVLFFDEADALFGARSEVHDAKDRYANTEISYLLQRIEAFDGIVVMATNIRSNMDAAFLRRIRYVVRYENPDEALRREIWESCLTEGLPHEEIDLDYLAAQFDTFTGSIIKTVFLNACAYAAGQEEKLGMRHLIHAVRHELEKVSSVAFSGDSLGKYAYLS